MDCRSVVILGLALLSGTAGCVTRETLPTVAPNSTVAIPAGVKIEKEKELPRRQPRNAESCLAYGRWLEREARAGNRPPMEEERLLDQARQAYQQALAIEPKNLHVYLALGRLYANQDNPDRAIATFRKGLEVGFQTNNGLAAIVGSLVRRQPPPEANPLAMLWYELGMCYSRKKDWEHAFSHLRRALELEPENKLFGNTLGFCLARAGRYDESLAVFRMTVGEAKAHYQLAQMLHHLKDDERSKHHLQMAIRANPRFREAHQLLAQLEAPTSGTVYREEPTGQHPVSRMVPARHESK